MCIRDRPYKDYVTPGSNVKVQEYLRHSSIKVGGSWAPIEDVQVKDGGAWRDVKEVHVKSGGSWRLVHEGEHFHFIQAFSSFLDGEWNIPNWVANTAGYSGNKIKGVVILGNKNDQNAGNYSRQLNLGNFSSDSIIYLRLQLNSTIIPAGGNGGNVGNNGQNGQRGLYSRTNFILDNAGMICGGGGGGAGGNDSNYTYPVEQAFGCIVGFSGKIINIENLKIRRKNRTNTILYHRDQDDIVSPTHLLEAKDFFLREKVNIETHLIKNCGHHIPIDASSICLLYTSPSPRDLSTARMPSSA